MLFRLGAVLIIGALIHRHTVQVEERGLRPIRLSEVKTHLPGAHLLRINPGVNGGFRVLDKNRNLAGFATKTMPRSRKIKGYSGPSDVLLVYNTKRKLLGITVRHSYDTPSHVEDVVKDYHFMEQWNGKTRKEIGAMQALKPSKFHIVSGASRTSEAIVKSVTMRAAVGDKVTKNKSVMAFRWQDAALIACAVAGVLLTFAKWPWLQRRKLWIHILMVLYIGLISGDLLAQSLLISWAGHGVPWNQVIGLVIMAAAAFIIPWFSGKPTYCTHLCPHGHAQRWLMKLIPAKRKLHLGNDEKWSFSALPGLLLLTILAVTFLNLPIDLAGFEPFDAWSIKGIGIATCVVAIVSLIFSFFVPMGYCRYGCPTGFLLELVRKRKSGFSKNDCWLAALLLVAISFYLSAPQ